MVRWEANCTENERQHARKQKEWLKGVARAAAKARGVGETPSKSEFSGDNDEDEDEEEIIFPCLPLPLRTSPRLLTFLVGRWGSPPGETPPGGSRRGV
jgi:hypothetical protein